MYIIKFRVQNHGWRRERCAVRRPENRMVRVPVKKIIQMHLFSFSSLFSLFPISFHAFSSLTLEKLPRTLR
jgi:hypothetical protein